MSRHLDLSDEHLRAVSVRELSELWGCSTDTVERMIRRGDLPSFKVAGIRRIPADAVARIVRGAA